MGNAAGASTGLKTGRHDRPGHPKYQDYFFLAPNVRFTRTPESDLEKRRSPQEGEDNVEGDAIRAGQASSRPVPVNTGPVATSLAPSSVPAPPTRISASRHPGGKIVAAPLGAIPVSSPAPLAPARLPAVPETADFNELEAELKAVLSTDDAVRMSTPYESRQHDDTVHWPYLSDHAFFELASPDDIPPITVESPAPIASTRIPAVPHVAARVRVFPVPVVPEEITSLFRVIECHGGIEPSTDPLADAQAAVAADPRAPASPPLETTPAAITRKIEVGPQRTEAAAPLTAMRSSSPQLSVGVAARPADSGDYEFPSQELLQEPPQGQGYYMTQEQLEQNADLLESVLEDFGVRGEIIHVRPGPVVTLYEFEPAPGVKSSRVIGLADDIARSMSAVSARVAVVPGRNVIGIELPNETRETVYFRELIESGGFRETSCKLALCLGKTIGGEPVIAELAKMPHLLVAGTTGSGKSVAINTMILSILYRLKPEECRLIMVDPKMLELSVYDGIPHLLTPVVTDPKKAVTALKWAVREMEDRYRKMARLGVRNIDGYNQRAAAARDKGETVVMQVQTGFEKGTGEPLFEEQEIDLAPMPYIVVIVDEMADLMMVAGKEIEGAIQRLAQMARAAGIHLIMATQRPSVDVITGTIKANFPTRISFQVTSKIDSRTILGEQGAEQLLGQGDMLYMAGGGRIARVHGPFVSDEEVEQVVAHLKAQGRPEYLETVTADGEDEEAEADQGAVFDKGAIASEDGDDIYDQAVKVVLRDKKCSTSYIQRRLGVGYNRAASLVERMEKEGLVGAPNHVGKREIMAGRPDKAMD
ncbi:DNA translocase FtsK [Aquamicrobium sp. LC103]|uniref:DNA translocase FtsK n=1 Tax=Aquamicrobium sp. LC103 TaxID=1120658 RepID=UPI00069C5FDD|nr:DNA translocase FtsK [Aquamicrobium sp. LC103]